MSTTTPPDPLQPLHGGTSSQQSPTAIHCSRCDETWTGLTPCHCGACHLTFTGIRAFDIHRTGGHCNDPSSLLTRDGKPRLVPIISRSCWSGWAEPKEDTRWDQVPE